jgi:hypothetical protein
MSSASVCSRREPSKIVQGKHSAALGKRQTESPPPWKGGTNTCTRIAESINGAGISHRPSGAGTPRLNASPGFYPGLFSSPPSGRNGAGCLTVLSLRVARLRQKPWNLRRGPSILSPRRRTTSCANTEEARLPQGLRFTDVRRSAIGDFPLARGGTRASKSHGRFRLRPSSRLLCLMRLPSAASLFCAYLPGLLDGVCRSERKCVRALRRLA